MYSHLTFTCPIYLCLKKNVNKTRHLSTKNTFKLAQCNKIT